MNYTARRSWVWYKQVFVMNAWNDLLLWAMFKLVNMRWGIHTPKRESNELTALHAALYQAQYKIQELKRGW